MKIEYAHTLGKDEALKRIKTALVDAMSKYSDKVSDVKEEWSDNIGKFSFSTYGFTVKVQAMVGDALVTVEGKIPWLISSYSEKIEQILLDNIKNILAG